MFVTMQGHELAACFP